MQNDATGCGIIFHTRQAPPQKLDFSSIFAGAAAAAEQSQVGRPPPAIVPRDEISREGPPPHSDIAPSLRLIGVRVYVRGWQICFRFFPN